MIARAFHRLRALPRLGAGFAAAGLSLVMGAATANQPAIGLPVLGFAVAFSLLVIAGDHQRWFFVVAAVSLALVPIYASPFLHHLALEPTAGFLWLLGGAIFLRSAQETLALRLSAVDGAALLFFTLLGLAVLAGARSFNDPIDTAILWLGPYLGARLLVESACCRAHGSPSRWVFLSSLFSFCRRRTQSARSPRQWSPRRPYPVTSGHSIRPRRSRCREYWRPVWERNWSRAPALRAASRKRAASCAGALGRYAAESELLWQYGRDTREEAASRFSVKRCAPDSFALACPGGKE